MGKRVIWLTSFLLLLAASNPVNPLILPPDPFDATDRYALIISGPDGLLTHIRAKIKSPGAVPLGSGTLVAEVRYKLPPSIAGPSPKVFYFSASNPVPIEGLDSNPVTMVFNFNEKPIPDQAYSHQMEIFFLSDDPQPSMQMITEYPPERFLRGFNGEILQTEMSPSQTAVSGDLILGPFTFLRERGAPQTETVSITLDNPTGVYFLRLANGNLDGRNRVSAAVVALNGQAIFRPEELSRKVGGLDRQVVLQPGENTFQVEVRGAPGTFITLELFREDSPICRALGPHTFMRATGKPNIEEITFPLGPQLSGPFTLHLKNGQPDGTNRVDSAEIMLNGITVVDSSQFNEQVPELNRVVSLQSSNTLQVKLNGSPGDQLTLEITGFDAIPPQVTITSPAAGQVFSASPITVTGTVDDPTAVVTVNGVVAVVNSDGTFTAEGVPIEEGENTLTVVATDSCGNKGQNQITVNFQTGPVGPELLFCAGPFAEGPPDPPFIEECPSEALIRTIGTVMGEVDETAESIEVEGVLLPDGVWVSNQGSILSGTREGTFFWALVRVPEPDGPHTVTAVATDAQGQQRTAEVTLIRDTVPPPLTITYPENGAVTGDLTITITGTVDDPNPDLWILRPFFQNIPVTDGTFEVTVDLTREGRNQFWIVAWDFARNASLVILDIYRDIIPPTVSIFQPSPGQWFNSTSIQLSGRVLDSNPASAVVSVNGGPQTPLTLSGPFNNDFNDTVTIVEGSNYLVVEGTDKAGHTGTSFRGFWLDTIPPTVNLTSPLEGKQVSGIISVTTNASDNNTGLSVRLLVDGQVKATRTSLPYTFNLDTILFPPGSHTISVQAVDLAGNSAEDSVFVEILPQIRLQIDSPADGATINKPFTLVKGTFSKNTPEVGITVNGVLAQTYGNQFAANQVPLAEGNHTLTVQATDGQGLLVESQVNIQAVTTVPYITLGAGIESGTAPLETTMTMNGTVPITSSILSYTGPGSAQITQISPEEYQVSLNQEGIYFFTAQATDDQNNVYTDTLAIVVPNLAELDALLKGKWEGMKTALTNKDTEGSLRFFADSSKEMYRYNFTLMNEILPQIVADMGVIQFVRMVEGGTVYEMQAIQDGQVYSFYVLFVINVDGLWKIRFF